MTQSKYIPFVSAAIAFVLMIIITIIVERFWYAVSLRYILDMLIGLVTIGTYYVVRFQAKSSSRK